MKKDKWCLKRSLHRCQSQHFSGTMKLCMRYHHFACPTLATWTSLRPIQGCPVRSRWSGWKSAEFEGESSSTGGAEGGIHVDAGATRVYGVLERGDKWGDGCSIGSDAHGLTPVWCVYSRELLESYELVARVELRGEMNLELCDQPYHIRNEQDLPSSDHVLFCLVDMTDFTWSLQGAMLCRDHGHSFCSAWQLGAWYRRLTITVEEVEAMYKENRVDLITAEEAIFEMESVLVYYSWEPGNSQQHLRSRQLTRKKVLKLSVHLYLNRTLFAKKTERWLVTPLGWSWACTWDKTV